MAKKMTARTANWRFTAETLSDDASTRVSCLDFGSVLAEDLAQRAAHLAHAGLVLQRRADRRQQVLRALRGGAQLGEALLGARVVALGLERLQALELGLLGGG